MYFVGAGLGFLFSGEFVWCFEDANGKGEAKQWRIFFMMNGGSSIRCRPRRNSLTTEYAEYTESYERWVSVYFAYSVVKHACFKVCGWW